MSLKRAVLKPLKTIKPVKLATVPPRSRARTSINGALVRPRFDRYDLINAESALGRTIFGPVPEGHSREFFQHSKNIWIWHETWREKGIKKEMTLRYEVRPSGVYKKLQGSQKNYKKLEGDELENFRKALHAYLKLVRDKLY